MRTKSRLVLGALALTALAAGFTGVPALGSGGARPSATKSVSVRDDVFRPKVARIDVRDKVVWRWRGFNEHNVRFRSAPDGARRPSGSRTKTSGRFARTFKRRGSYRYVCTIHEDIGMKGRVVAD